MLEQTASEITVFGSLVGLASVLGLGAAVAAPASAGAGDALEQPLEEYSSPDGTFALQYPMTFKVFSKPLKTHKLEVRPFVLALYRRIWLLGALEEVETQSWAPL